ncbi:MAG TPA: hypothetical protein VF421_02830 [Niabella sp.]
MQEKNRAVPRFKEGPDSGSQIKENRCRRPVKMMRVSPEIQAGQHYTVFQTDLQAYILFGV